MINVTDEAKQELIRIFKDSVDWPGACLRLMDRGNGKLGLGVDIAEPNDNVVQYDGLTVLIVAPDLAANLKQVTLDVECTAGVSELIIVD